MMGDLTQSIVDWLAGLSARDIRHYLILGGALICAYLVVRWFVRRFVPWLIRRVLLPAIRAIVLVLGAAVLTVQALCAAPFRVAGAAPPVLVHRLGDAGMGVVLKVHGRTHRWAIQSYYLRVLPRVVVVLITAAVLWGAHQQVCRRDPAAGLCRQPAATVSRSVVEAWELTSALIRPESAP